jgi:hypothetical protein
MHSVNVIHTINWMPTTNKIAQELSTDANHNDYDDFTAHASLLLVKDG